MIAAAFHAYYVFPIQAALLTRYVRDAQCAQNGLWLPLCLKKVLEIP